MFSNEQIALVEARETKGSETKRHILDTALGMFREQGFDETTMRAIAAKAGLSIGAAYHYFPSKESFILAYYERVHWEHERRLQGALTPDADLRARLGAAIHTKLDIMAEDRKMLGALLRYLGNPNHPLSIFAPELKGIRDQSIGVFEEVLDNQKMPEDLRAIAPVLLWILHLGLVLYLLHDNSEDQKRTRRLVNGSVDLVVQFFGIAGFPLLKPIRRKVLSVLEEARLTPPEAQLPADSPHSISGPADPSVASAG